MPDVPAFSVPLIVSSIDAKTPARKREPVRVGLPMAKGLYDGRAPLSVYGADGQPLPTQTRVLDRWSDGSARWLLVDFEATHAGAGDWTGWLRPLSPGARETGDRPALVLETTSHGIRVNTGVATFQLQPGNQFPFSSITLAGAGTPLDGRACELDARDTSGAKGRSQITGVNVEDSGPLRATVLLTGAIEGLANSLKFEARLTFFAGSGVVRVELTLRNPERATHPGGRWDLGDPGSVLFSRLSLRLPFASGFTPRATWSIGSDHAIEDAGGTLEILSGFERRRALEQQQSSQPEARDFAEIPRLSPSHRWRWRRTSQLRRHRASRDAYRHRAGTAG